LGEINLRCVTDGFFEQFLHKLNQYSFDVSSKQLAYFLAHDLERAHSVKK